MFKAPESTAAGLEYPYQVIVTRYMEPRDTYKLRLGELPFEGQTVTQDMIDSIEIILDYSRDRNIKEVKFARL